MNVRSAFRFRFTTAGIVMIPVAVGINYVGKELAYVLNLPMWLDSIGTILSAVIAGPWIGAISGAVNNVFFGLTMDGGVSIMYGITSVAIAIVAGLLAAARWFRSLPRAILAGILIAVTSAVVSTPINVHLYGGQTAKVWGDAILTAMMANHFGIWLSSFVDEFTMDLIDKIVVAIIVYLIAMGLPKRLIQSFHASNTTIRQ